MGFWEEVWRFITFKKLRETLKIGRAADRQFTGSVDGIRDAYDIHQQGLITDAKSFFDAVSQAELAVEEMNTRLKAVQKAKAEHEKLVNGALSVYERAQAKNDTKTMAEAEKDGNEYQAQVTKLTKEESDLQADIETQHGQLAELEKQLSKMQDEIKNLPAEKAAAISKYVSSQKLVEAYERVNGLKSHADRSPIDAVQQAIEEQAAKARVAGRLAHTVTDDKKDKYLQEGVASDANSDFQRRLAARKAELDSRTGTGSTTDRVTDDKPKI